MYVWNVCVLAHKDKDCCSEGALLRSCLIALMPNCVYAYLRLCLFALPNCIHAYLHSCLFALPNCVYAYLHSCLFALPNCVYA